MCGGGGPKAPAPDQQPVRSQRILLSRAQYNDLMIGSGNGANYLPGGVGRGNTYDGLMLPSPASRVAGGGGSGSSMPTASGLRVVR